MKEQAVVVSTSGDKAVVEVGRSSACASCGKCSIGQENKTVRAEVLNTLHANEGDIVSVELEFSSVLSASAIAYGIPFLAFVIGAVVGYYLLAKPLQMDPNITGIILGFALLIGSYFGIRAFDKKGAFKQHFKIKMVK